MKIQFTLHDSPNPNAGGMGVTAGLTGAYEKLGSEVDLLSFADVTDALPLQAQAMLFPVVVAKRLWRSPADVIDAAIGDGWLLGHVRRLGRSERPTLICRSHGLAYTNDMAQREEAEHGTLELSWKYPLYWGGPRIRQETSTMRTADMCLFLNDGEREIAVNEFGVSPARTRVVDNGLPEALIGRPLEPLDPLEGSKRIAHIGRYLPHKGIRYLVEALEAIFARHPDARATLLGTVCDPDLVLADFKPEFRAQVDLVSTYQRDDLPNLLRGHGVVLSSSLREAWLLGGMEGMACGLVPVMTDIPGPTQYVRGEENGILVPAADGPALAAAVERLIAEPELFDRLRASAHASAQLYTWDRIGAQTLEIYAEAREMRR